MSSVVASPKSDIRAHGQSPTDRDRITRPATRLISVVWGEDYLDVFLAFTLPAILAPGNLPALVQRFDCTLVLVTEKRLFDRIESSEAIRRVRQHCPLKLVSLDDLIEGVVGYGLALTYALHRGFDDLGPAMCDTFLIFFNADFILADGSFATLADRMAAGERLIFSPSYCVVAEDVKPRLATRIDPETGALEMSKREMASLALDHLHNTVRAKTINRRFFSMHVTDQMYWRVDADTLLGHQFPIAIVCMRPQQVYTDPICFWDYATISMACPTANRCVLGDSDEYLMIELRSRDTFREHLRFGAPSAEEVGRALGDYMTPDQIEMGRYELALHAKDLPPAAAEGRAKLKAYLDRVYRALPRELPSPVNHRFWTGQAEHYFAQRENYRAGLSAAAYRRRLAESAQFTPTEAGPGPWPDIEVGIEGRPPPISVGRRLFGALFGFVPRVTSLHPFYGLYRHVLAAVDGAFAGKARPNSLFLYGGENESMVVRLLSQRAGTYTRATPLALFADNIPAEAGRFDLCLCELDWMEVNEFPRFYQLIKPRLAPDGVIVVFHESSIIRTLEPQGGIPVIEPLLPQDAWVRISFSSGRDVMTAVDGYRGWLQSNAGAGLHGRVMRKLARDALRNWRINRADARRPSDTLVSPCLAMMIEIRASGD